MAAFPAKTLLHTIRLKARIHDADVNPSVLDDVASGAMASSAEVHSIDAVELTRIQ